MKDGHRPVNSLALTAPDVLRLQLRVAHATPDAVRGAAVHRCLGRIVVREASELADSIALAATAPNASARFAAGPVRLVRPKVNARLVDETSPPNRPVTRYPRPGTGNTTRHVTRKAQSRKGQDQRHSSRGRIPPSGPTVPPGAVAGRRAP
jgi:hypothetical protein